MRITAANLAKAISNLNKNILYEYINPKNKGKIRIESVTLPEGPIRFSRLNIKSMKFSAPVSISTNFLWRVANTITEGQPFNIDRIVGASFNYRSVFETLLAHSPEFYWCTPGRIELINSTTRIKKGHKHLVWIPNQPHENNTTRKYEINNIISEIPSTSIIYESLEPNILDLDNAKIQEIDVKRRHLQIQIALIMIGQKLNYRTWIAQNDKGILYGKNKIADLPGVIPRLLDEPVLSSYPDGVNAALHIDCIWFKNGRLMPAVFEIEHSTGVLSGLTRMRKFYDLGPALRDVRWIIVAPDEDREDVIRKASQPQFKEMNPKYLSYSSVEELYSLCQRRNISSDAVNNNFLDCFMEKCIS